MSRICGRWVFDGFTQECVSRCWLFMVEVDLLEMCGFNLLYCTRRGYMLQTLACTAAHIIFKARRLGSPKEQFSLMNDLTAR